MLLGLQSVSAKLFNLIFPDDCRICEQPLQSVSRIPVCASCLALPQPLAAEFFCRCCRTPYLTDFPLDEQGLCSVCRESKVNFDAVYSFGLYEEALRELIHLFKYSKVETLARPLGRMLTGATPLDEQFDVVLPMPMHWRKHWDRGFNQAELLAEPVAKRYGLKLGTNLRRRRHTKAQAGLSEAERQSNLEGALQVAKPEEISGKRVLLVDDVFTTGATLRAAAAALKEAGAFRVVALTLARVDRRSPEYAGTRSSSRSLRKLANGLSSFDEGGIQHAPPLETGAT